MIEPFPADLFAGAVPHGFFHIVSGLVGVQRIQPYQNHVFVLGFELRLAVDGPGEIPVLCAVLDGDDTAGRNFSGAWVTLADVDNVLDDLLVRGGDSCTHPVCGVNIAAKDFRFAVFAVFCL